MTKLRSTLAILLAAGLAVAVFAAQHDRRVTVITSIPYAIIRPGSYRLGTDLKYPASEPDNPPEGDALITIAASNVTLDFGGHHLIGPDNPATALYGVSAYERENVTVKNGVIESCYVGIVLRGSESPDSPNVNHLVANMVVTHCRHVGVVLTGARNCKVRGCRIDFIGPSPRIPYACGIVATGYGILLRDNLISDVTPRGGDAFGIFNNGSTGIFAVGNVVSNCRYGISAGKNKDNLTSGCQVPYFSGVDAGGNN